MTCAATPTSPSPTASDESDDLREFVEVERDVGSEAEIEDAFAGLAAYLLDLRAARQADRGGILAPLAATNWPHAAEARERVFPLHGEA